MDVQPQSLPPLFIKFRVTDQQRFQLLLQAFEIIKQEKLKWFDYAYKEEEDDEDSDEDNNYYEEHILQPLENTLFDLFDEQALAHFWWPSKQETEEYYERWFATPIPQRFTDPSLKTPWGFTSMIDSLMSGEYELLFCRLITFDTGVLEFDPFSYPYGGTACMKALVEAFECRVIGEDEGGQPYISYEEE